ncbi:MAG: DUF3592 domain-containing protein [Flavobacteriales bacterium]|nr:DUF3592 domain-containing protein [Flavobacteriales bacterium]
MSEEVKWTLSILCIVAVVAILVWRLGPVIFFDRRAKKVRGVIVNWMSAKQKGKTIYKPIIKYIDHEGTEITHASDDRCEGQPEYPVGTEVEVKYDPKDPKAVRIVYPEKS